MYLSEDYWRRKTNVRANADIHWFTTVGNLFPNCEAFAKALAPIAASKNINTHFLNQLTAIDKDNRRATMRDLNTGTETVTANADVPVTGFDLTFTEGAVTTTGTAVIEPTGEQIDSALGTETIVADANISVTGIGLALSDGDAEAQAGADVSVIGEQLDSALGSVDVEIVTVVEPIGVSMQFAEGIEVVTADANVPVTGQILTFAIGQETIVDAWEEVKTNASNSWTEVAA